MDVERLLGELGSSDPDVRARAARRACPCRAAADDCKALMPVLEAMKKDPDPDLRGVALLVGKDAFVELRREDELAAGYDRNRPGGHGEKGQPKYPRRIA